MKNTLSAAVALPTVVAIALGGLLMAAPAASAAPAPVEQSVGGAVPVDETAPAEAPAPPATPERAPVDEPGDVETEAPVVDEPAAAADDAVASTPTADAATTPTAAEVPTAEAAVEPAFAVTSPAQGQVLASAGVRVEGTAPTGSRVVVTSSDDGSGVVVPVVDGTFAEAVSLPALSTAESYTVTVQVTGADGAELGVIERTVVVAGLPTNAAPTISTPGDGSVVEGIPYTSGDFDTGAIEITGTGTPGAIIDLDLDGIDPDVSYGYDYEPAVVKADGTWAEAGYRPYGTWRVSIRQLTVDADGFVTALPSSYVSVVVDVVPPAAAPAAAPVVTSPAQGSTVVGRPDRSQGAGASPLEFTVSGTGTPGSAIAIYGYFDDGRAAIDRYAAAARGESIGDGEFEPLVAGLAPIVVAADGTWTTTQSLVGPGTYSFAAFALTGDLSFFPTMSAPSDVVTFTLVVPTATATTASLAFTGDDGVGPWLAGGVLAIGLGAAALALVRRRGRRVSDAAAGSVRRV
ncbi:hypothetical protein [Frigoribacterium sp. MCBA15_019]|uniref:hypothetical protein n=1 Tax=Frigoribacterium sp. MCBA15_019 TaxID=1898745 RepID=UPI0008DC85E0|nr:hypothetical protein [Frigoribacterium sp. MCBA15_019]OII22325.1 hypothetical protein BIV04_08100 [Frigoribacterium sp. MCBA15_019]